MVLETAVVFTKWAATGDFERSSEVSYAESRESTSERRAESPAQTSSRYARRSAEERSRAAPTMLFMRCQFSGLCTRASLHLPRQPGLRHFPVALSGRTGNAQHVGNFLDGQAAKESQFHNAALLLVQIGERAKGIIQGEYVGARHVRHNGGGVEVHE